MKTFNFYFLIVLFTIIPFTLSNCASDDQKDNVIQPEVPNSEIPHSLALSYKKVINNKEINQLIKTDDNGYIGIVFSEDYQIVKFDSEFNIIWEKSYGGSKNDYAEAIIQDKNGNFFIIGASESSDGDVKSNFGSFDI